MEYLFWRFWRSKNPLDSSDKKPSLVEATVKTSSEKVGLKSKPFEMILMSYMESNKHYI